MARRPDRHLVLELDGGRGVATVFERRGRRLQVAAVHRREVEGVDDPDDVDAIADWVDEIGGAGLPVHVLLADAGLHRFELELPRLSRGELAEVVRREARLACGTSTSAPVQVGTRAAGRTDDGRRRHAVLAAAPESFAGRLLSHERLAVVELAALDEALLAALPDDAPARLAVVDADSSSLRVSYLAEGQTHQRRIQIGDGLPEDATERVRALGLELARTLDYLADLGLEPPDAVAFAPSLALESEDRCLVADPLAVFTIDAPPGEHGPAPDLATLGWSLHAAGPARLTTLGTAKVAVVAPSRRIAVAAATLALLAAAGVVGSVESAEVRASTESRAQQLREEVAELRERVGDLDGADVESRGERARLRDVLGWRRPASRLLAEVCAGTPAAIVLDELVYDDRDRVTVRGHVGDSDRLGALDALTVFQARLREFAFLQAVEERVGYEPGEDGERLTFEMNARWRADR